MKLSDVLKEGVWPGLVAGSVSGLVFGAAMSELGMLSTVASLVRVESNAVGVAVHMVISAVVGAGFGVLMFNQRVDAGETLFWGLTYGILWWFLGPLTLMPLLLGDRLIWGIHTAQAGFPSLLGHLWYGIGLALTLTVLRRRQLQAGPLTAGALLRGAIAGLLGALLLGGMLDAQHQLPTFSTMMMDAESRRIAWSLILMTGLLAGTGYALLYPKPHAGAGAGLVRGTVYGFFWWVVGALTLIPLVGKGELAWSLEATRSNFAFLPGYILFGATLTLLYQILNALGRVFFADITLGRDREGVGTRGLRMLFWGGLAGIVGGLLFTLVMVQVGFLPVVAGLINATAELAGFIVHLTISILIGASYGLLFRGQSYDVGSALGWGASFGFFWWILGPLTLMPMLLGVTPEWTVAVATVSMSSLIGHLAYGAGLGITFHWLETRYNPWWIPFRRIEATRIRRRKRQLFTSAPALWVMVVIIALILPIVLNT